MTNALQAIQAAGMVQQQNTNALNQKMLVRENALNEESDTYQKLRQTMPAPTQEEIASGKVMQDQYGPIAIDNFNMLAKNAPRAAAKEKQYWQGLQTQLAAEQRKNVVAVATALAKDGQFQKARQLLEANGISIAGLGQAGGAPSTSAMNAPQTASGTQGGTNALVPPQPAPTAPPQTVEGIRGRIAAGTNYPFVVDQGGAGGKSTAQELATTPQGQQILNTAPSGTPGIPIVPKATPGQPPAPSQQKPGTRAPAPETPMPTDSVENAVAWAREAATVDQLQKRFRMVGTLPDVGKSARQYIRQEENVALNEIKTQVAQGKESVPADVKSFEMAYGVDPKFRGTPQYIKAFEHYKTAGQQAYGAERIAAMLATPQSVYDTTTGNFQLMSKEEIVKANKDNEAKGYGSRFVGEGAAKFVKPKLAAFNEIESSSQQVKDALQGIDFSQKQIAKFSQVLKDVDDGSTIKNFLATDAAKTLTPQEISYVTAVKNLKESAFALRGISGMGQGSDLLRTAIAAVVPGTRTPNKEYALSALARFDTQVQKLREGVPGLGAEGQKGKPTSQQVQPPSGYKDSGKTSGGKAVWLSPDGKQAWVAE